MDDSYDYPAAHSMDTMWFSVDADGHVAAFSTGEAGAVPTEAYAGEDHYALADEIRKALPRGEVVRDLPARGLDGRETHQSSGFGHGETIFFVATEAAAHALASECNGKRVAATTGYGVIVEGSAISDRRRKALHDSGECLRCAWYFGPSNEDEEEEDMPVLARYGLFEFDHETDNWIAGPYARATLPAKPIDVAALPQAIRDKLVRFEGRFADTTRLQPAEHWPSEAWGAAFLATDGKTVAPLGDREAEYLKEIEQLHEIADDFIITQPDGTKARMKKGAAAQPTKKPWWKIW